MGSGPDETGPQQLQGRLALKAPHEDEESQKKPVSKNVIYILLLKQTDACS